MTNTPVLNRYSLADCYRDKSTSVSYERGNICASFDDLLLKLGDSKPEETMEIGKKAEIFPLHAYLQAWRPNRLQINFFHEDRNIIPEHIIEAIKEAKVLLTYQFDWDDNGGVATDEITFNKASFFLKKYSEELMRKDAILPKPFIDIMPDGSISIKWDTIGAKFFIIFKKSNSEYSYYYGERKNEEQPAKIKDGIKNFGEVDSILLTWMKEYLCAKNGVVVKP